VRYVSLGSGSKGNSTLIEHDNRSLLIDCGFSRKNLLVRLQQAQSDGHQLEGLLVTHEHSDHAKGAMQVCELFDIPLYCSAGTAIHMKWTSHRLWNQINCGDLLDVAGMKVGAVTVPHDAREPLQFVVEGGGRKLGVLSDLGSLTRRIVDAYKGCHGLQLEANHDPDMLKVGPYPPSLQKRVAGPWGHLSNAQCADLIRQVYWDGVQHITAGHISEKNNHPDLVFGELAQVLGRLAEQVEILAQDEISGWREL